MTSDDATARRKQLAWIRATLETNGWTPTRLAREAGISQSTLAKFLGDPLNAAHLSLRSVERIARVSPLAPYATEPLPGRGFAESDAQPYDAAGADDIVARAVAAAKAGRNHVDPWVLRSRALEAAGYLPGDVLIVDLNARPEDGDVVCAQVYDRRGNAETVFRVLERPFLVAAMLDRRPTRPLLVDDDQVVVRGVVVASVRPRQSRLPG
ncbi:MAG TPA: hypothetical protein GYA10_07245 [Alphaproteobacteria bacterium]|nr:hypothetical protein [Alphaproteobacteria bacterium]